MLPGFPGANIKEFWLTILSKAKRLQTQCLRPKGEFWVCSEANSRMVQNSFQRAKGNSGNRPRSIEAKKQRGHIPKYFFPIKSTNDKNILMKTQNIQASGVVLFQAYNYLSPGSPLGMAGIDSQRSRSHGNMGKVTILQRDDKRGGAA
jgi:hypothetical protein